MSEVLSISIKTANGSQVDVATITALIAIIGEVASSPTANTLLDRLKAIRTSIEAGNTLLTAQANMLDGIEPQLTALGVSLDAANARAVQALGARTVAQSPAVNIATDQPAIPVDQKTTAHDITAQTIRPDNTTAYAAGDIIGSTTSGVQAFPAVGKSGGSILITGAQLEIDVAAVPAGMTWFRLYLYSATPPSALADNGSFDFPSGDRNAFLGFIDLGTPVKIGAALYCEVSNIMKNVKLASTDLFGYLVTAGGFAPANQREVYKVTLHTVDM